VHSCIKSCRRIFVLITITAIVACSPSANTVDQTAAQTVEEAQSAFVSYVESLNEGDYTTASQIYDIDPGFHWIERGSIQYQNGAEAASSLQSFEASNARARMTTDQMIAAYLSPTSVFVSTHFDFAMLNADDSIQFAFDGWMSVAMVKKQGRWVFAAGQVGPGTANP